MGGVLEYSVGLSLGQQHVGKRKERGRRGKDDDMVRHLQLRSFWGNGVVAGANGNSHRLEIKRFQGGINGAFDDTGYLLYWSNNNFYHTNFLIFYRKQNNSPELRIWQTCVWKIRHFQGGMNGVFDDSQHMTSE